MRIQGKKNPRPYGRGLKITKVTKVAKAAKVTQARSYFTNFSYFTYFSVLMGSISKELLWRN